MSLFITNQNTRVFNVELATVVGLNESIVLQQIQYWIEIKMAEPERYKDSEHDNHLWVYNSINSWREQFPFWSYDTVKRTLKSLEKKGILISGVYNKAKYDKTKWYRIDYEKLDEIMAQTLENTDECILPSSKSADCPDGIVQFAPTNIKEYTESTSETTIECIKGFYSEEMNKTTDREFSYEILERQILKCIKDRDFPFREELRDEVTQNVIHIFKTYYDYYYCTFGEYHPILSNYAMNGVIDRLFFGTELTDCGVLDTEMYDVLIEKHFMTNYSNCDYNICHFMTDGIRDNRYYETCY